jgi:aryl-alcohol dehydrogenase-like predicted oxidoreductase
MLKESVPLGGQSVRRMGFGAMQLPGPGVFGPPKDRDMALRLLRRAVDAGVNHIDTAQFYGPDVANELLREALFPYPDELVIVSKVGAARDEHGQWHAAQRPEQLRAGVEANLESLGLEQVPVVNLRRHPESDVLLTEQLDAMEALRQEGLIGRIGLSNVDLEQYRAAQRLIDIACVQNSYNLADTSGEDVFDACLSDGVPFVPFFSVGLRLPSRESSSPSSFRADDGSSTRCNAGSSCARLVTPASPNRAAHPRNVVATSFGGKSCRCRLGARPRST